MDIFNTESFRNALEKGQIAEAEHFLDEVKNNPDKFPQYNERWIDHREREVYAAYRDSGDYMSAKRIVEGSINSSSKTGRKDNLQAVAGIPYDQIA